MKNTLLIAHHWKTLGWLLTVPAFIAGLYFLQMDNPDDYLKVQVPVWMERFLWVDDSLFGSSTSPIKLSLLDEIICLSLFSGLLLLAFSKEKIEDEWIQQVRLESFQWAILINTLLLIAFTIFTHGFPFLNVMLFNMFTPLIVFVVRFHYVLRFKPLFSKA